MKSLENSAKAAWAQFFKARQQGMDRLVALKILPPKLAKDEKYVQRFLREARSAGAINHPNLVNAIDCGNADGYYYFSMELVEGPNLKQLQKEKGALPGKNVIRWLIDTASALEAAHNEGIVHRDVKPENILLTAKGRAKLADLGLAKPISGDADVTMGGVAIGTPHYLSPEQARGQDTDGRSDIYSLGATAFHLLTNETLFSGPTGSSISVMHVSEKPRHVREVRAEVSSNLDSIVHKCLQKKPENRYQSAAQLIEDLKLLKNGEAPRHVGSKKRGNKRAKIAEKRKALDSQLGYCRSASAQLRSSPLALGFLSSVVVVKYRSLPGIAQQPLPHLPQRPLRKCQRPNQSKRPMNQLSELRLRCQRLQHHSKTTTPDQPPC